MVRRPRPHRVEPRPVRSQVVHDEEAAGLEEADDEVLVLLGRVLEAAAVEEDEPERASRREEVAPVAHEELDVRERREMLGGDRRALGVYLRGDDTLRHAGHGSRTLAERGPGFRDAAAGREHGEQALHLRDGRAATGHVLGA